MQVFSFSFFAPSSSKHFPPRHKLDRSAKLVICKPQPILLEMNAAGGGRDLPSFKFPIYKNCLHPTVSSFHLFSCFSVFSQENIIGNLEITHFAIFSGIYQTSGNMNPTLTLKCLKGNGWKSLLKITSLQFVLFPAAPISWKELLTFHS